MLPDMINGEIKICEICGRPMEFCKLFGYVYPSWVCFYCEEFWDIEDDEK